MRILMLGAGGVGGYFGAKMHQVGGDVTFLVRPLRAASLRENGLKVLSPLGDMHIKPKLITTEKNQEAEKFDVIILSCKAYDLDAAIESVAPFLDKHGIVIPLLNGLAHLPRLDAQFSRERVLGGLAHIGVTMQPSGEIQHLNDLHRLMIGSRTEQVSTHVSVIAGLLSSSGIDFLLSEHIEDEMWGKYIFLTALAGVTCTMRSAVADILKTNTGEAFVLGMFSECLAVGNKYGYSPSHERHGFYRDQLSDKGSLMTASMLRDIERNAATEAEHILGDMVERAVAQGVDVPLLKLAYTHLQAYGNRRLREQA